MCSLEWGGRIAGAREQGSPAHRIWGESCFFKGYSTHVDLPEKIDVVVADQIGNFGFNAGVIEYFAVPRRRFLKPERLTLPLRMNLMFAPVVAQDLVADRDFWISGPEGLDFRFAPLVSGSGD